MPSDSSAGAYHQQSLLRSFVLHILPGALVTLGFTFLKPWLDQSLNPPLLAFLLAVLFMDLPLLWGIMLYAGMETKWTV